MALLLFYLFLALTISFLCSVAESVLLSTPLSFLRIKEESGKTGISMGFVEKETPDEEEPVAVGVSTEKSSMLPLRDELVEILWYRSEHTSRM